MKREVVEVRHPENAMHGAGAEHFDVTGWANGLYNVPINCDGKISAGRIVVAHQ